MHKIYSCFFRLFLVAYTGKKRHKFNITNEAAKGSLDFLLISIFEELLRFVTGIYRKNLVTAGIPELIQAKYMYTHIFFSHFSVPCCLSHACNLRFIPFQSCSLLLFLRNIFMSSNDKHKHSCGPHRAAHYGTTVTSPETSSTNDWNSNEMHILNYKKSI